MGRLKYWRWPAVVIILLVWCSRGASQGAEPPSQEEFEKVPVWTPEPEGAGIVPRVDLRPFLPPIGNQGGQGSCVGWAVAYGCKTYIEGNQRGWDLAGRPPTNHLFSPAFVYNQLNGGKDRGCNVNKAVNMMRTAGCATLATMPYTDKDFIKQPSDQAKREALNFRSTAVNRLTSAELMRTALRQGYVVVVCVRTDPEFTSGRHALFLPEHRELGDKSRRPTDPHGYHAMCVVGYDDTQSAFLFMNSWGPKWCGQGYIWVSYDLIKEVKVTPVNFLQEAYVILNLKQVFNPDDNSVLALAVSGDIRYLGFENGQHSWAWKVSLAGRPEELRKVAKVAWRKPGKDEPITSTNAGNGFAVNGTSQGTGVLPITGEAHFADGKVREFTARLIRKPVASRQLVLVHDDRYWGNKDGKHQWEWTARLRGNFSDLVAIRSVTYHLDRSARNPDPVIASYPEDGFAFTTIGPKAYPVKVTVQFQDGSILGLETKVRFLDTPHDDLTLATSVRMATQDDKGRNLYYWSASIDGPFQRLQMIKSVTYSIPSTTSPPWSGEAQPMPKQGFPMSGRAWGTPTLRARITFQDGHAEGLTAKLRPPTTDTP